MSFIGLVFNIIIVYGRLCNTVFHLLIALEMQPITVCFSFPKVVLNSFETNMAYKWVIPLLFLGKTLFHLEWGTSLCEKANLFICFNI